MDQEKEIPPILLPKGACLDNLICFGNFLTFVYLNSLTWRCRCSFTYRIIKHYINLIFGMIPGLLKMSACVLVGFNLICQVTVYI